MPVGYARETPPAPGARAPELLLAALALALGAVGRGPGALRIELEGHGREPLFDEVDLTRTAGWFTTIFPLVLDLAPGQSPGRALAGRAGAWLRAVPRRGLGYGLLQDRLGEVPPAELCFNYLGQPRRDGPGPDAPLAPGRGGGRPSARPARAAPRPCSTSTPP